MLYVFLNDIHIDWLAQEIKGIEDSLQTFIESHPEIKGFYDTLIQNHKKTKVALVACMRKLLSFIDAILKNNVSSI